MASFIWHRVWLSFDHIVLLRFLWHDVWLGFDHAVLLRFLWHDVLLRMGESLWSGGTGVGRWIKGIVLSVFTLGTIAGNLLWSATTRGVEASVKSLLKR